MFEIKLNPKEFEHLQFDINEIVNEITTKCNILGGEKGFIFFTNMFSHLCFYRKRAKYIEDRDLDEEYCPHYDLGGELYKLLSNLNSEISDSEMSWRY